MPARVSCPYCNSEFDPDSQKDQAAGSQRVTCPRCGESFLAGRPNDSSQSVPTQATPAAETAAKSRLVWYIGASLALIAVVGVVVGLRSRTGPELAVTKPALVAPPATKPPTLLTGVRLLSSDTNLAFAFQPSPVWQYAERNRQNPYQLLTRCGLPAQAVEVIQRLGIPPEQIDHLVVGVVFRADVRPSVSAVLALRTELADEGPLRKELRARSIVDRPGVSSVVFGGLPMEMLKRDPKTYLFSTQEKELTAMQKNPADGVARLPSGLRNSLLQLSPASFAWTATDSDEWTKQPWIAAFLKSGGHAEQFAGVEPLRALAVGLSTEPELQCRVAARWADAATATKWKGTVDNSLASMTHETSTEEEWLLLKFPLEPPQDLRALLSKMSSSQ